MATLPIALRYYKGSRASRAHTQPHSHIPCALKVLPIISVEHDVRDERDEQEQHVAARDGEPPARAAGTGHGAGGRRGLRSPRSALKRPEAPRSAAKRRASWSQCTHEMEKSQGSGDFDT